MTGRRAITVGLVLCSLLGLTLDASAGQSLLIVSAGDSYASGEGAPEEVVGLNGGPARWLGDNKDRAADTCHRSRFAAAADAAGRLATAWPVEFASVACSGGTTGTGELTSLSKVENVDEDTPHRTLLGAGGQLDKIQQRFKGRTIDALLLTIGGNDIGFGDIVMTCMFLPWCQGLLGDKVSQELRYLPVRFGQVIDAINSMGQLDPGERVGVRNVFLVQYPDTTTGTYGWRCGIWPVTNPEGGFEGMSLDEAEWASTGVVAPLNAALADAVAEAERRRGSDATKPTWHLVRGVSEEFQSHGYCARSPVRFINTPADSFWNQGDIAGSNSLFDDNLGGSMHPNWAGQRAYANPITSAMWFLTQPAAEFANQSVPSVMLPGQTYSVSVTMKNTGKVTWTSQANFRLGSQAPQDNGIWGRQRVDIPTSVPPDGYAVFNFTVTAPTVPGSYTFQWQMLQEMVQWFGAPTAAVQVSVPSPNRQMSLRVVENLVSPTTANVTVVVTDRSNGAPVSASITLNGSVVGSAGQPFTYSRAQVQSCEPVGRRIVCIPEYVEQEFLVTSPGFDSVSFVRY